MEEKWISVDEELPKQRKHEGSEDVLIAIRYKYDLPEEKETICTGYLLDGEWWSYFDHNCHKIGEKGTSYEGDKVTHWMALPEPPIKKGEIL